MLLAAPWSHRRIIHSNDGPAHFRLSGAPYID
jgi:hypothetical protein